MSELEKTFGPKTPTDPLPDRKTADELLAAGIMGGSRWHCEDRIRPALDAFIETMGDDFIPRSPMLRRNLYASARPIVDEVGEDQSAAFVRWACSENARRRLDTKDLRSLAHLIPHWRTRRTETPDWMRTPCRDCCTFHPPGPCEGVDEEEPSDADLERRREEQAIARRLRWPDADQADPPDDDR